MITMEYGLIGKPLKHSFSPELHKKIGDYSYVLSELEKEELAPFFSENGGRNFRGINVTIPYKSDVIPFLSELDPAAKILGSVNTIVNQNGYLKGYNTDLPGFLQVLKKHGVSLKGKKTVIFGSGGTAKTFAGGAFSEQAGSVIIVSRDPERLKETVKEEEKAGKNPVFSKAEIVSYDTFYEKHTDAEFIFNATPVGMFPNDDGAPCDLSGCRNAEFVFDAVYHPLRTDLILDAQARGIKAAGGLSMLVYQGVESAALFGKTGRDREEIYREVSEEKQNLTLIGMPSSGKSTVGRALAALLGKDFLDTDELFEDAFHMSAGEYIKAFGEAAFREKESLICRQVSRENGKVVATGGGLPLFGDNARMLKRNGPVIYLRRSLSELIPTCDRPLSSDKEKLRKLYELRTPLYEQAADFAVDGGETAAATAKKIRNALKEWEGL